MPIRFHTLSSSLTSHPNQPVISERQGAGAPTGAHRPRLVRPSALRKHVQVLLPMRASVFCSPAIGFDCRQNDTAESCAWKSNSKKTRQLEVFGRLEAPVSLLPSTRPHTRTRFHSHPGSRNILSTQTQWVVLLDQTEGRTKRKGRFFVRNTPSGVFPRIEIFKWGSSSSISQCSIFNQD